MPTCRSLFSLTPGQLVSETRQLLAARAENTAELLEHLAEIDSRRLYVEAAYSSMQAFCAGELHMSLDSAEKKLRAARAVRRVPALLPVIADGRLHLSAVILLAPNLTPENAGELIAIATHRSCAEIRTLLAERVSSSERTGDPLAQSVANPRCEPDLNPVMSGWGHAGSALDADAAAPAAAPTPSAPKLSVLQFTVPAELAQAFRDALALAPYEVARDPARAFAHMLAAWREKLEKRRFGSASRPGRRSETSAGRLGRMDGRHVPAVVRRAVWQRDGGRCTFASDAGKRCECRNQLEFDHVRPIARGGRSTADNLRLRCRAHNQLEAERAFGKGFVDAKRQTAKRRTDDDRLLSERAAAPAAPTEDIAPWLRRLGYRREEIRAAASLCDEALPDAPLEQRVRLALTRLARGGAKHEVWASPLAT